VIDVLIYNDELIVELLFIIVLPLTFNDELIVTLLFNVVLLETFNAFRLDNPDTFKSDKHDVLL